MVKLYSSLAEARRARALHAIAHRLNVLLYLLHLLQYPFLVTATRCLVSRHCVPRARVLFQPLNAPVKERLRLVVREGGMETKAHVDVYVLRIRSAARQAQNEREKRISRRAMS